MQNLIVCLITLMVAMAWHYAEAAEPIQELPYTFTINGMPFTPRVFSLHGDPDHLVPGDLIAVGELLLTLGPERNCRFVIPSQGEYPQPIEKVSLQDSDDRNRVVGVCVFPRSSMDRKSPIVNPLTTLSADEIHGLWGLYLDAWSDDIAKTLPSLDPARTCLSLTNNALIQQESEKSIPPLPKDIQYLNAESIYEVKNVEPLRRWTQLRFLRIEGGRDVLFDARWLAQNRALCRLDLRNCRIEHPEALSQLGRLESLDLSGISNLDQIEFAGRLPRLRSFNVSDTAVWDLSDFEDHKTLARLDVSYTKVRDLGGLDAKNLENLNISETMVRDLSPLGKLRKLVNINATNSTVEKLPIRPMPQLRNLTVFSTPLSQASLEAFSKQNPQCAVMFRWTDALRLATAGATRLRIRSGGPGHSIYELMPFINSVKTLLTINDAIKIRDFVRMIEIDEKNSNEGCWDGCCLEIGPTFEFYQGDKLLAAVGWTDIGLTWIKHWPMADARLTPKSRDRLIQWLAQQGYKNVVPLKMEVEPTPDE